MSATEPTLHIWVSFGDPAGSAMRVAAHVCGECHALVTDRRAHQIWHTETLLVLVDERIAGDR